MIFLTSDPGHRRSWFLFLRYPVISNLLTNSGLKKLMMKNPFLINFVEAVSCDSSSLSMLLSICLCYVVSPTRPHVYDLLTYNSHQSTHRDICSPYHGTKYCVNYPKEFYTKGIWRLKGLYLVFDCFLILFFMYVYFFLWCVVTLSHFKKIIFRKYVTHYFNKRMRI